MAHNADDRIAEIREDKRNKSRSIVEVFERILKSEGLRKAMRRDTQSGMMANNIVPDIEFFIENWKKREGM